MHPTQFDLTTKVSRVHWELEPSKDPLEPEFHLLREDLIQIQFTSGVVVDVGWYPSFAEHGGFRVLIVRDACWDAPLREASCRTLAELRDTFGESLAYARSL